MPTNPPCRGARFGAKRSGAKDSGRKIFRPYCNIYYDSSPQILVNSRFAGSLQMPNVNET